ncbi:hypothetical protein JXB27_03720, partial [Candidatus Woesearchaeota archaeon]|nr:hypothetical protein [Candidatus Woesearchaeota archaeon]
MKHRLIIAFLIGVSFLIAACPTDLPPNPDSATFSAPLGKATEVFEGYAVPTTFTVNPNYIAFQLNESVREAKASVSGDQYVYKYGYIYDNSDSEWNRFQFSQPTVGLSNWIKGFASQILEIKRSYVANQTLFNAGQPIYIIAYACSKEGETWNCHENKWMLNSVKTVLTNLYEEELPPEPGMPGGETTANSSMKSCVQADGSTAVCFLTKLNEPLGSLNYSYIWGQDSPTYLADGKYVESAGENKNSANYFQFINLTGMNYPVVVHAQDDDLAPIEGDYLMFKRSSPLWSYNLHFYDAVRFETNWTAAKEDFAGTTITILGKVY